MVSGPLVPEIWLNRNPLEKFADFEPIITLSPSAVTLAKKFN